MPLQAHTNAVGRGDSTATGRTRRTPNDETETALVDDGGTTLHVAMAVSR